MVEPCFDDDIVVETDRHPHLGLWPAAVLADVDAALSAARNGRPVAVVVEGDPGIGKSSLLEEVCRRATDFAVLSADAPAGQASPYAVFEQWGLSVSATAPAFMAAQELGDHVDRIGRRRPVVVRLDDLQWADIESVNALVWMVRRAVGDRFLVLVGTRSLAPGQFQEWQRWVRTSAAVTRIHLTGLPEDLALELVRRQHPHLATEAAHLLWAHTGGNPLYLSALLTEHDPAELVTMRVLPAPAEYEQLTTARLERLDEDAVTVVRAAAVLDTGWTPLPMLAAVAQVADIAGAAERAQQARLLQMRTVDGSLEVRPSHALTRSSIYCGSPMRVRRQLHLVAADVAGDVETRLGHRVQAATAYDDGLAGELEAHAVVLHGQRSYRLAAQFLEWAGAVTSQPAVRERRRLDSLFERQLAGQQDVVAGELASFREDADPVRVLLLQGHAAVLQGRPAEGVRALSRAVASARDDHDALPASRASVLLSTGHLRTGASAATILADIERAHAAGPTDPALDAHEFYSETIARLRGSTPEATLEQLAFLPSNVIEVLPQHRDQLSARGNMRLLMGMVPEAIADLREAHQRIAVGDGVTDIVHSAQLSSIGIAHWLHGQWDMTRVAFNLVEDISPNPTVHAYRALLPSGTGDFSLADRQLAQTIELVQREAWQEAVQAVFVVGVVRAHAGSDPEARAGLLADTRARWPHTFTDQGVVGAVWFLHAAQAAIWAGDLDLAERWTGRLECSPAPPRWAQAATDWLRGLRAERSHRDAEALTLLRSATAASSADLPFYRAHLLSDHARLAERHGRSAEAAASRGEAQRLYRRLGAAPYIVDESSRRPGVPALDPEAVPTPGLRARFGLSEREEDVATLVVDGMSYAQVARELFITRSTVGFHLGNVYAKVGVTSRHELSETVRSLTHSG